MFSLITEAVKMIDSMTSTESCQTPAYHRHPTGYALATPEGSRVLIGRLSKFLVFSQMLSPYRGDANQPFRCY
jgi:hypothetical protein